MSRLRAVKIAHTIAWAFFAGCILAIPWFTWRHDFGTAWMLIAIVAIEVAILLANDMRCPLTAVAARLTRDRRDNFDIYLPAWLARHNKQVFGTMYAAAILHALLQWGFS
jgi:hypothetical protein